MATHSIHLDADRAPEILRRATRAIRASQQELDLESEEPPTWPELSAEWRTVEDLKFKLESAQSTVKSLKVDVELAEASFARRFRALQRQHEQTGELPEGLDR